MSSKCKALKFAELPSLQKHPVIWQRDDDTHIYVHLPSAATRGISDRLSLYIALFRDPRGRARAWLHKKNQNSKPIRSTWKSRENALVMPTTERSCIFKRFGFIYLETLVPIFNSISGMFPGNTNAASFQFNMRLFLQDWFCTPQAI